MDSMALAMVSLLAIGCYAIITLRGGASMAASMFSWFFAIPVIGFYFVQMMTRLDSVSIWMWQGDAQIGPVTLILIVIGISWLLVGGNPEHERKH